MQIQQRGRVTQPDVIRGRDFRSTLPEQRQTRIQGRLDISTCTHAKPDPGGCSQIKGEDPLLTRGGNGALKYLREINRPEDGSCRDGSVLQRLHPEDGGSPWTGANSPGVTAPGREGKPRA